ncbi:MAG: fatty acyl-CoA reductase [Marinobacter sp.]|uniref:fatty acyl-CoA reductase n=1 Tax=Marinobacter sp. TaxID=50741 RepID=UPI0029C57958|nr:fatty acyl-CoA reductase [Marinobacter sp.]MDX5336841.1 fatty acyl-CoA reductase [Marinobacter sp.]MDX5388001.1 fatty acyl-CoA reductase [Marinobacter sp.]MDX5441566.1 fatty acyl-CoA reductase [Alteromonadaceae bacterium]MDX5473299.1 fatty acyl-CoA reductase [Marinobacter sp.]
MANQQVNQKESSSKVLGQLRGKRVLITGTTGFLGKVVLEKLIRSVPDIGGIYLLIRGNKRHPDARSRFDNEIATSSVFDRLRSVDADWFETFLEERVHCITGEVTEPCFGMGEDAWQKLAGELDAVINSAASVNFREELDKALTINTLCLENIAGLARQNAELAVLQVSTCYVNGMNSGPVTESVIKPAGESVPRSSEGYYEIEELVQLLQDKIADVRARYSGKTLEKKLVDLGIREANRYGWSDTYTFTKWLGEQLLMKALNGRRLTIVRPSIIESALEEPAPGWIEGVKVADAIILAYAREKVTLFPGKRSGVIDVIPVDLVANAIVLSLSEALAEPGRRRIYQCCSGSSNPVSLGQFIDHLMAESKANYAAYDHLFYRQPSKPFIAVNRTLFDLVVSGVRLPLSVTDKVLKLLGNSRDLKMLKNLDTTQSLATIFGFYTAPDYIFHNEELQALSARMGEVDKGLFPVDARQIDWEVYLRKIHLAGLNRYALKERKVYSLRASRQRKKAA